jgi:cellulose synthase/poly-beta-1,6-N-acetylglucosamine synthase-like glycosyltransferase
MDYIHFIILGLYALASFSLAVYGFHCYLMIFLFLKRQKNKRKEIQDKIDSYHAITPLSELPFVTIQLPFYNEKTVVERVIFSATELNYPKDKYEIQILDDSTDETVGIVDQLIPKIKEKGINISVIRRTNRQEFKAGALANGMKFAKGNILAIFDADFIIPPNFLNRAVPLLVEDPKNACVQGRWGHINSQDNWLTKAQSIGIDGHFTAEQGARSYFNLCLNFNGTAGIWSKEAILAGGGWQGDTLTEDLDLSYRVQMEGYKIIYDFDNVCLSEIPADIMALKSQQKRWAKGSMQTAIKLFPKLMENKTLAWYEKIESLLHMTHYSVSIFMIIICCITLPVMTIAGQLTLEKFLFLKVLWVLILLSALAPCVMYTGSGMVLGKGLFSFRNFPFMIMLGTGLCLNNACAVIEAFTKKKTAFIRTPKSGSTDKKKLNGSYRSNAPLILCLAELILGFYAIYTSVLFIRHSSQIFGVFILSYAVGMTFFGLSTLKDKVYFKFITIK